MPSLCMHTVLSRMPGEGLGNTHALTDVTTRGGSSTVKQDRLIASVRETAGIATTEESESAVRATLRTLGERLVGGETRDLASQLPPALARELPEEGPGERFDLEEFYARVARYEGSEHDMREARRHARAVAAVLRTALSGSEFEDLAAQLPSEYDDLLQTGPVVH